MHSTWMQPCTCWEKIIPQCCLDKASNLNILFCRSLPASFQLLLSQVEKEQRVWKSFVCVCVCLPGSGFFFLPSSNFLRPFWHISKYKYTTRFSAQSFLPFKSLKCALMLCAESIEAPDSQVRLPSPNTVLVHLPSTSSHSCRWCRTPPSPLCVCVDSADNQVVPRCPWITAR